MRRKNPQTPPARRRMTPNTHVLAAPQNGQAASDTQRAGAILRHLYTPPAGEGLSPMLDMPAAPQDGQREVDTRYAGAVLRHPPSPPAIVNMSPSQRMPAAATPSQDHPSGGSHSAAVRTRRRSKLPGPTWSADTDAHLAHLVRQVWAVQKIRIGVNNQVERLKGYPEACRKRGRAAQAFDPELLEAVEATLTGLEGVENDYSRQVERLMRRHPLAAWIKDQRGIGPVLVAYILASTGPLSNFPTPSKLWKFLGMHVDSTGRAPRRVKGQKAGWSQRGRMTCYQLGASIVKAKSGPWNALYKARRASVLARERVGVSGCPFGHDHHQNERRMDAALGWERKTGKRTFTQCVKLREDGKESSAHVDADAKRVAVKAFLLELWRQANGQPQHA